MESQPEIIMLSKRTSDEYKYFCIHYEDSIKTIFVGTQYGPIIVLEQTQNGNLIEKQKLEDHFETVYCLSYNQKAHHLYSAGQDEFIRLWERNSNGSYSLLSKLEKSHKLKIFTLHFSEKNQLLFSGSFDKKINIYHLSEPN